MKTKEALRWIPAIVWYAVIFWQSSLSRVPGAEVGEKIAGANFAALAHVLEYGAMAFFIAVALRLTTRIFRVWLGVFLLTATLGALDELHQAFVPGRLADIRDLGWDILGAGLALGAWRILRTKLR